MSEGQGVKNEAQLREERIRTFIEIQLGQGSTGLPFQEQKERLAGKSRKVWVMMLLNLGFVIFFTASFYFEITRLSGLWLNLIIVFFIINVFFFAWQRRQLKQANEWLDSKLNGL
jgi:hypothetical protein